MQTREEIREYLMPLIQERRQGAGQDLISLVARADDDGLRLTDEEICAFTSLVIVAGGETTDSALASMFKLLIEHPAQLEAVWNDRRLIRDAFAEQLRFAPPVHMILRIAAADVEVGGARIPKGAKIGMVLAAANRDDAKFKAPEQFDIFREDNNTDRAFRALGRSHLIRRRPPFLRRQPAGREEVEIATNAIFDNMCGPPRFADGFEANETGIWFQRHTSSGSRSTPTGGSLINDAGLPQPAGQSRSSPDLWNLFDELTINRQRRSSLRASPPPVSPSPRARHRHWSRPICSWKTFRSTECAGSTDASAQPTSQRFGGKRQSAGRSPR